MDSHASMHLKGVDHAGVSAAPAAKSFVSRQEAQSSAHSVNSIQRQLVENWQMCRMRFLDCAQKLLRPSSIHRSIISPLHSRFRVDKNVR